MPLIAGLLVNVISGAVKGPANDTIAIRKRTKAKVDGNIHSLILTGDKLGQVARWSYLQSWFEPLLPATISRYKYFVVIHRAVVANLLEHT